MNSTHPCNCGCCRAASVPFGNSLPIATVPGDAVLTRQERRCSTGMNLTRRSFIQSVGAAAFAGVALGAEARTEPGTLAGGEVPSIHQPLKVQPVLTYSIPHRRESTSWREWGGIQTEEQADEERRRIQGELSSIRQEAEFAVEFLPLRFVRTPEQATQIREGSHDVLLLYAAGGGGNLLERMIRPDGWNLMFLRHASGPAYLWYEIVHPRLLRKTEDEYGQPGLGTTDVIVDEPGEILWRLRGLYGLKNTLGKKIVAIGGASGWGAGGQKAPEIASNLWKLALVDYPYSQLEPRLRAAFADPARIGRGRDASREYLKQRGTRLETARSSLDNAFVLLEVMKDILRETGTNAITVNQCMGTIMGMSHTTACMPLSVLNDEGCLAFCESDFVVIPSGILLHYVSAKPVFLNDPTFPHGNVVTLAHCTAPRRMDGRKSERARLLTHFESDYGVAPKVEMRLGQKVTNLVPDFGCKRWVGFSGSIVANPFLDICRSQIDVRIEGDAHALMAEMKGFHWMTSYGDYLREVEFALSKVGVGFLNVSQHAPRMA